MRQRRWLYVVKDCDCEILYHPDKANLVADVLSRRAISSPIWDMFKRMTVMTPILEIIKEAQPEAIKEENRKSEWVVGQVLALISPVEGF